MRDNQIADVLAATTPDGFQSNVYVTAIFDDCYAAGMMDGTEDLGARLQVPSTILAASQVQGEAFEFQAGDSGKKDAYAPGFIGMGPGTANTQNSTFTNYLLKGLGRSVPAGPGMEASLTCPGHFTTPADAEGDGDCVTTARELFDYAERRTEEARYDPLLTGKPQVPPVSSPQIPQILDNL